MRKSIELALLVGGLALIPSTSPAQSVTHNSITLSWTAPGDDSLTGTAAQYDLRYSTSTITAGNFASATRWTGTPTPASPGSTQSATVTGLSANTTYFFAIKTADEVPNWAVISNVISRATLAAPDVVRPAALSTMLITASTEQTVSLRWTATGDDSLTGTAASFDVRYSSSPITEGNWNSATLATGEPTPGVAGTIQNMTISSLTRQTTYYFAGKVADDAGNVSALSNVVSVTTPDQTSPASIRDLVVGFLWFGWRAGPDLAVAATRTVAPRPHGGGGR